ncbi:MAG: glycerate kinase [Fastidiosipilaceae bacterium]|jgi:glycerate kinase
MKFMDEKKIILIPDSFKGTMSSIEVCEIMEKSIKSFLPKCDVVSIPVADGGEGTVDALVAAVGGEKIYTEVTGPKHKPVKSFFGLLNTGEAVIEMAAAAGLPMMGDELDVMNSTSFGVGELIIKALEKGRNKIVLGIGGSATNDGGAGAAAALGVRFLDKNGNPFVPVGATLKDIESIDTNQIHPNLKQTSIKIMSDINNPLCGENGAAAVFGAQKGATKEMMQELDEGLRHFSEIVKRDIKVDILNLPGAGAAGGMGGGIHALFDAELEMGIDVVLDVVKFEDLLKDTALVFSGEGKIDSQSLGGKVVIGIAKRTKKMHVPLIAVVGDIADDMNEAYEYGVSAIVSINRVALPYKKVKIRAESDLKLTVDEIMRLLLL